MTLDFTIHRFCSLLLLLCLGTGGYSQVRLNFEENYSLSYDETIQAYQDLDKAYPEAKLLNYGLTDVGKPLNLFVISSNGSFEPQVIREEGKGIILIMNGIHPGESCGIDASILFARDILEKKEDLYEYLDNTVVCIIPVYNIGGALNRSAYHRTNMDPPVEAGFRGNAQNLDLNRDFIKLDSRNARSFTEIFRLWDPDVFLDNHVTNGSDHQYTITLINSVIQQLDPGIGDFLEGIMLPELYSTMKKSPYEMIPYVHFVQRSPEMGIVQMIEPPRYSSGYASLNNTLSFLNEIHVYKLFPDQVKATYHFLIALLETTSKHAQQIARLREEAKLATSSMGEYVLDWELDSSSVDTVYFKGYAFKSRTGEITGQPLPYYDRNEPWEKEIPYYKNYKPGLSVSVPVFYVLPQVWTEVISRLELNRIEMERLLHDTVMKVEAYYIEDISYGTRPYNGHFMHSNIRVRQENQEIQFYKGDVLIPLKQEGLRYLMETLDPRGGDSFMLWNFFDPVLDRREYIDPSIFEKTAIGILENDPELRSRFEKRKAEDPGFARSGSAQLNFIYTNSEWAEKTYRRYPVYRINRRE